MMTVQWEHRMADVFKFLFHKDNSPSSSPKVEVL
jgi:hypothetical protein